ncbi:GDSL-like Lipase/Acylhydrolase [Mariniflexile rhizosphaerae]|uniref:GDSL-type esterase/lipase family protein n=1 Tax=unclassified Mariniflexile TaxID=2643887 RepID=UPI000E32FAA6|nr:GDSL-type esterase/lipase family protein [Mariniflexile sp. TRM1-10]AXP81922.1 GDSL-like Lipase/Acylhydrolase [Mariniflexile sp. TRM1-10]
MTKLFSVLFLMVLSINTFGQSSQLSTKELTRLFPTKKVVSRYHNNWTQNYYPKRIQAFKKEPLEFGEIVFIGNSITEGGLDWSGKFGKAPIRNRGIAGDVTDGVLKRLNEITYFKPKAVFILIGINDLFSLHHEEGNPDLNYDKVVPSPEYIGKNILKIAKIIHRKSPVTKVYVRTLLPTRREYLKEDILLVNKMIRKNEVKGYYEVIDFYDQFVDTNGELIKELTKDGVHLNDKGYETWVNFEKPIIEGL